MRVGDRDVPIRPGQAAEQLGKLEPVKRRGGGQDPVQQLPGCFRMAAADHAVRRDHGVMGPDRAPLIAVGIERRVLAG